MEYRQLGAEGGGLRVSALGLGCMTMTGWYGTPDPEGAAKVIHRALDLGLNFLDTSDVYQSGLNERFVGETIRGRRDQVVLATKCGLVLNEKGFAMDGRPEHIRAACDASLQRLGVEVIDLYYLHRVDPKVPVEDSVGAMAEMVAAGKVRHLGLSEAGPRTLRRAAGVHPITALQSEYSLWTRDPEDGVLAACRQLGIGFVPYSPLGRGYLTGNFDNVDELPEDDNRRRHPRFRPENIARNKALVERVHALAAEKGCSPAQLALAWLLAQGDDIVPIPGTKRIAYLEDDLGAIDVTLEAADLQRIDEALPPGAAAGLRYPEILMDSIAD